MSDAFIAIGFAVDDASPEELAALALAADLLAGGSDARIPLALGRAGLRSGPADGAGAVLDVLRGPATLLLWARRVARGHRAPSRRGPSPRCARAPARQAGWARCGAVRSRRAGLAGRRPRCRGRRAALAFAELAGAAEVVAALPARIARVTADDVREVLQRIWPAGCERVAIAGPEPPASANP